MEKEEQTKAKASGRKEIKIRAEINEITITPDDLIFIDDSAMVVIYQEYEQEVIERALNIFNTEINVVKDILNNKKIDDIIQSNGTF